MKTITNEKEFIAATNKAVDLLLTAIRLYKYGRTEDAIRQEWLTKDCLTRNNYFCFFYDEDGNFVDNSKAAYLYNDEEETFQSFKKACMEDAESRYSLKSSNSIIYNYIPEPFCDEIMYKLRKAC